MTCQELNLYLDDFVRNARLAPSDHASVAAHLSTCDACRHLFEERTELEANLRLVHDSIPELSEQMEARILAGYRQLMSEQTSAQEKMFLRPAFLAWAAFAAAALILGAALISVHLQRTPITRSQSPVPQTVPSATNSEPIKNPAIQAKQAAPKRRVPKAHQPAAERALASTEVVRALPEDFRRLMYCDALSCAQDMDMIHVQLPSAFAVRSGRPLTQPGGLVNAEVLVGPDGIARGIRFEQ